MGAVRRVGASQPAVLSMARYHAPWLEPEGTGKHAKREIG